MVDRLMPSWDMQVALELAEQSEVQGSSPGGLKSLEKRLKMSQRLHLGTGRAPLASKKSKT